MNNFVSLAIKNAHSEDSDKTVQIGRLIWIFTGCKCPKLCFLTLWRRQLLALFYNIILVDFNSYFSLCNLYINTYIWDCEAECSSFSLPVRPSGEEFYHLYLVLTLELHAAVDNGGARVCHGMLPSVALSFAVIESELILGTSKRLVLTTRPDSPVLTTNRKFHFTVTFPKSTVTISCSRHSER